MQGTWRLLSYTIIEDVLAEGRTFRLEINGRPISTFGSEAAALSTARSLAQLDRTSGHSDVLVTIERPDGTVQLLEAMVGDALSHDQYASGSRR